MALEDFTTYTEVDTNSRITVTENTVSFAGLLTAEEGYVYTDFGVDFFAGDFSHDFRLKIASGVDEFTSIWPWCVANDVSGDPWDFDNSLGLEVAIDSAAPNAPIYVRELSNGSDYWSASAVTLTLNTDYYCTVARDESIGTYGQLSLAVFSDEARTSQVGSTITLALHNAKRDFRYLYALRTIPGSVSARAIAGEVGDVDAGLSEDTEGNGSLFAMIGESTATTAVDIEGVGTMFALTGEATIKDVSAQGDGAFDQMTAAATTGAIGSGNLYALTGEAAGVKGKAAAGAGALYALTGEATTGAEGDGTFFALTGESEAVTGHLASGAGLFDSMTGEAVASVTRHAAGAGSFALIYGGANATKGHVGSGSASLYALRGESAAVKGHGMDGDADLYLMTGGAAGFGQADLDGDAGFYLMTGNGEAFMQGRFGDEYILYHRRPA